MGGQASTTGEVCVRPPWHSGMLWSLALLVISRVLLLCLAPLAEPHKRPHFHDDHVLGYYWHGETRERPFYEITPNIYLDMWARSDSWQYLDIAEKGYYLKQGPGGYGTVACFPLYPLLVRAICSVVGGYYLIVAILISTLATWAASVLLYQLAEAWKGRAGARMATLGLFSFPSAFFLTTVFPHSLFLALCLASLLAADRGRFLVAGFFAALAGATRVEGVVLIASLAVAYWQQHQLRVNREALGLVFAPLGLVAYMVYLGWRFENPLAFVAIHEQFGRTPSNPLITLLRPIMDHLFNVRHFLTYLVLAWLIVATIARAPRASLVFGWMMFLVPLATGQYESIYRVQLTTFPVYLGLAAVWPPWAGWLQIILFAGLQAVMCYLFIMGVRLN